MRKRGTAPQQVHCTKGAELGKPQTPLVVRIEITLGEHIDLSQDCSSPKPVHNLVLIAAGRRRVSRRHRNDELGRQAALHHLGNGNDVMPPVRESPGWPHASLDPLPPKLHSVNSDPFAFH